MSKIDSRQVETTVEHESVGPMILLRNLDRACRRLAPGSLIEAGSLWLFVLCAGVLLLASVIAWHEDLEFRELRRARVHVTLAELSERLERNLALGFELSDDGHVQLLIEDLLERDRDVVQVEIFDINGVSLFNTDRGAISDPVPESWLVAAAQAGGMPWEAGKHGELVSGIIVRGPFRETAGYVAVTLSEVAHQSRLLLLARILAALTGLCVLAPLASVWALRGDASEAEDRLVKNAAEHILQTDVRLQFASTALRDADGSAS